ncbi:hypothetical protein D3C71_652800 [compost metagenome]
MHTEWMAATMGLGEASSERITLSRLGSCSALGVPNSLMSAPPENALPAPVMTMALTALSALALDRPSVMPMRVEKPRPLTGGLVRVITATSPSTLYSAVMLRSLVCEEKEEKARVFFFEDSRRFAWPNNGTQSLSGQGPQERAGLSRNTAEPALPGRRCCPLQGGWRSDTKCAKPGGLLKPPATPCGWCRRRAGCRASRRTRCCRGP